MPTIKKTIVMMKSYLILNIIYTKSEKKLGFLWTYCLFKLKNKM